MNLTVEIRARFEKIQELDQTLEALSLTIRGERGCRDCHISGDVSEEIFFLSVHWDAGANLEDHMGTNSGAALLGAIPTE